MIALEARTSGIRNGRRVGIVRKYDRVTRIELDFIPGEDDRPTQARVWHQVWVPVLRRYDTHVDLVIQDDLPSDLGTLDVEVIGLLVTITCTGCGRTLTASPGDESLIVMESWYEDERGVWCGSCETTEADAKAVA